VNKKVTGFLFKMPARYTIRRQLLWGNIIIGLVIVVMGGILLRQMNRLLQGMYTFEVASRRAVISLTVQHDSTELISALKYLSSAQEASGFAEVATRLEKLRASYGALTTLVAQARMDEATSPLLQRVSGQVEAIIQIAEQVDRQTTPAQWEATQREINLLTGEQNQLKHDIDELVAVTQALERTAIQQIVTTQRMTVVYFILLLMIMILVGALIIVWTTRVISRPISALTEVAVGMAAGDLNRMVVVGGRNEIGLLSEAFNLMAERLRNLVGTLEERVEARTQALKTSAEISRQITAILDMDKLLQYVVNRVHTELGFYHTAIYLFDEKADELVLAQGSGVIGQQLKAEGFRLRLGEGVVGSVAVMNAYRLADDLSVGAKGHPLFAEVRSELAAPLRKGGQILGVLDVQSNQLNRFSPEDVELIRSIADQTAIAVENARLLAAQQATLANLEQIVAERTQDVTRFKTLVESSADGIFMLDLRATLIYVNRAAHELFGCDYEQREMVGQPLRNFWPEAEATCLLERLLPQVMQVGHWRGEVTQQRHDGGTFEASVTLFLMRDEAGTPLNMGASVRDITQRKWAEQALRQSKEAADAANQAKSIFLANMSHELRTPLNGVLGYAQILKRDRTLSNHQRESINIMERSGEHLLTLLNDILDLSKIEAGKMELWVAEFRLPQFLEDLTEIFRMRAEEKGLEFVYQQLTDLPVGVRGDEKRLRQVLINLLGNGVKFTRQGRVIFRIGYHFDKIRFQVEDTGPGIKPEHLEDIFAPFQQAGDLREGTGLGLPISRKLVEMMGGRLDVASEVGSGSRFWFDLALPVLDKWGETAATTEPSRTVLGYEGPTRHVLIVDDQAENRAILRQMLGPLGFELREAADGETGFSQTLTFKPELILMDLVMPRLDGLEATRRIRQAGLRPEPAIIAISASAFNEDQQKSLEAGCNRFIAKPFQLDILLHHISDLLGLTWIYEAEPEAAPATEWTLPPQERLAHLFNLALKGKITEIKQELAHLEELGTQYGPFVAQMNHLLKGFKLRQMRQTLKSYLE
jgi:PAS domain S-box-containing protein